MSHKSLSTLKYQPTTKGYKAAANLAYLRTKGLIPVECITDRTRQELLAGDLRKEENRETARFNYAGRIAGHRDANAKWLRSTNHLSFNGQRAV